MARSWAVMKAAKKMKGRMFFGAIDCTAPDGQPVCAQYGVSGYPTPSRPAMIVAETTGPGPARPAARTPEQRQGNII